MNHTADRSKDRTKDTHDVTTVIAQTAAAWAAHDADAFGRLFTEDATYTTFVGTHYRGRADVVEAHRALWEKFLKGTRLAYEILDVRFHGADTAIVTTNGDTYKSKAPSHLHKAQTYTLVRGADQGWLIAAFHNTKHARLMEAISFRFEPRTIPAAVRQAGTETAR